MVRPVVMDSTTYDELMATSSTDNHQLPDHRTYTSLDAEGEAAVGRIAIWAAWLERAIWDLSNDLINSKDLAIGKAITANMTATRRIELSTSLINGPVPLDSALRQRALAALRRAKKALEMRNKILHSTTGGSLDEGKTVFHSYARTTAVQHTADELDDIGCRIHGAMEEIFDCWMEISRKRQDTVGVTDPG